MYSTNTSTSITVGHVCRACACTCVALLKNCSFGTHHLGTPYLAASSTGTARVQHAPTELSSHNGSSALPSQGCGSVSSRAPQVPRYAQVPRYRFQGCTGKLVSGVLGSDLWSANPLSYQPCHCRPAQMPARLPYFAQPANSFC